MPAPESFGEQLRELVERHLQAGAAPQELVDEMSRQVALIIDRNNLELEMIMRPRNV